MVKLNKHFKKIEERIGDLPNKLNFKIGETGNIVGVPSHVLRYWEKEFPLLKPEKFINKQRLYFKKDISLLLLIKTLIYEEKFSIEGLRKHLPSCFQQFKKSQKKTKPEPAAMERKAHQLLNSISNMRREINL